MKRRTALTVLATLALAGLGMFPARVIAQTPKYSVRNLGPLVSSSENDTVLAISSDGTKVVGSATYRSGNSSSTNAFYWDGTMHNVGVMQGIPGTTPISVTSTGLVLLGNNTVSVWTVAGGKVSLPSPGGLSGLSQAAAYAMNDAGVVAGSNDNPDVLLGYFGGSPRYSRIGLVWSRDVSGQWMYTELPPIAGHNWSRSGFGTSCIDGTGNVIGVSAIGSLDADGNVITNDSHLVLWSPSDGFIPHDLGAYPSIPTASRTDPATLQTRFVWNFGASAFYSDPTGTTELLGAGSPNPSASAKGVNVLGQVAGVANFAGGSHAFYWDTTFPSGSVMDLGVLPGMSGSSIWSDGSWGKDIMDDSGFIVGTSSGSTSKAFLSTPASRATSAKLLDLNGLLTANALKNAGLSTLTQARIINNAGFIVCHGADKNGWQRVALLTRVQ